MSTNPSGPSSLSGSPRPSSWLASHRRGAIAVVVVLLLAAGTVIGVTDPFSAGGSSGSGVTDNSYPTSVATVTEQSLSSQTQVDATLGYAGSYSVTIPSGVSATTLGADRSSVLADEDKVSADEKALADAEALATPDNASTLASAEASVSADETALFEARSQLSSDRRLGCPAASSATVTTATGTSATPSDSASSGSASSSSSSPSSSSAGASSSSASSKPAGTTGSGAATGNTGGGSAAQVLSAGSPKPPRQLSAPEAITGTVDATKSTSTQIMGNVDPGGARTTYYFEYGTSVDYGETTPARSAGAGTTAVSVSVSLSGLLPGQAYHYRLVAKNAVGTSFGQDATFETTAPPQAVTGSGTATTVTSETLAGDIDPGGLDTTYWFEWGPTGSFGRRSQVENAGAGNSQISVSDIAGRLRPETTYVFRLVARNSLGISLGTTETFQTAESSCVAEDKVVSEDAVSLQNANDALSSDRLSDGSSVASDEESLSTDEQSLAAANGALSADEARAANSATTFTALPATGEVLRRGSVVYKLDGEPVPLFYGTTIPDRALYLGVSDGEDVAELQQNLVALGFGAGISPSTHFSAATEEAVKAWQGSLGLPETGVVDLGDFVLEPGPIQVDTVTASLGEAVQAGATVLTATSTRRVVTISLDAAEQSEVKVGDPVVITRPDNDTTPGVVSSVGTVATTSSSGAGNTGGAASATISVLVTPTDPAATGDYDQAPVEVAITNASVNDALVVPVDALLALAGGGYALEEIGPGKLHHLVAVNLGLFDDADGLVQVSGPGVAAGERVVVPGL